MISGTMRVLLELAPAERHRLGVFCSIEALVPRHRDSQLALEALGRACYDLNQGLELDVLASLRAFERWLAGLPGEVNDLLTDRTDIWLRHGLPEDLKRLVNLLFILPNPSSE